MSQSASHCIVQRGFIRLEHRLLPTLQKSRGAISAGFHEFHLLRSLLTPAGMLQGFTCRRHKAGQTCIWSCICCGHLLSAAGAHLLSSAKVLRFREISSNEVKVRAAAGVVRSRLVTQPR